MAVIDEVIMQETRDSLLEEFEKKESWTDGDLTCFIKNQLHSGDEDRLTKFYKAVRGDKPLLEDIVKYIKISYFADVMSFFDKRSPELVKDMLSSCSRYEDSWIILERIRAVRRKILFDLVICPDTIAHVERVLNRWQKMDYKRKSEDGGLI